MQLKANNNKRKDKSFVELALLLKCASQNDEVRKRKTNLMQERKKLKPIYTFY